MLATARRAKPIPVFVLSFNRGPYLNRAIESIRRLSRPTEIIVQDNGSTDPATLALLAELEHAGIAIVRCPAIAGDDDRNRIDETVREFFNARGERSRYVVTDCSIDIGIADPAALDVYDELLDWFRNVDCVGPMLRIKDVPRAYPHFNWVMNQQIEELWAHPASVVQTSSGPAAYRECTIDTSFALHRAGERFSRPKRALRVYDPYEALRLDWYGSGMESDRASDVELKHDRFYTVRKTPSGDLESYEERLQNV